VLGEGEHAEEIVRLPLEIAESIQKRRFLFVCRKRCTTSERASVMIEQPTTGSIVTSIPRSAQAWVVRARERAVGQGSDGPVGMPIATDNSAGFGRSSCAKFRSLELVQRGEAHAAKPCSCYAEAKGVATEPVVLQRTRTSQSSGPMSIASNVSPRLPPVVPSVPRQRQM
jgi:hypothetical protein